jgi:hypothetical protein
MDNFIYSAELVSFFFLETCVLESKRRLYTIVYCMDSNIWWLSFTASTHSLLLLKANISNVNIITSSTREANRRVIHFLRIFPNRTLRRPLNKIKLHDFAVCSAIVARSKSLNSLFFSLRNISRIPPFVPQLNTLYSFNFSFKLVSDFILLFSKSTKLNFSFFFLITSH